MAIQLPELIQKLDLDIGAYERAVRRALRSGEQLDNVLDRLARDGFKVGESLDYAADEMDDVDRSAGSAKRAASGLSREMGQLAVSSSAAARGVDDLNDELRENAIMSRLAGGDASKGLRGFNRDVSDTDRNALSATRSLSKLSNSLQKFQNAGPSPFSLLKIPAIASIVPALVGGLNALGGGLVAFTGAIAPAFGILGGLPGLLAGLGTGIGAGVLGITGVISEVKDLTELEAKIAESEADLTKKREENAERVSAAEAKLQAQRERFAGELTKLHSGELSGNRAAVDRQIEKVQKEREAYQKLIGETGTVRAQSFNDSGELAKLNEQRRLLAEFPDTIVAIRDRAKEVGERFKSFRQELAVGLAPTLLNALNQLLDGGIFDRFEAIFDSQLGAFAGLVDSLTRRLSSSDIQPIIDFLIDSGPRVFTTLTEALLDVIEGFGFLAIQAEPVMDYLLESTESLATRFRNFGQQSELNDFFERSADVAERLFDSLGNYGRALVDIFQIGGRTIGDDLLDGFVEIGQRFENFTTSIAGSAAIGKFFEDLKPTFSALIGLFGDIGRAFGTLNNQGLALDLIQTVRTDLLPVLVEFSDKMGRDFLPALLDLAVAGVSLFTKLFETISPLKVVVDIITAIATAIQGIIELVPGFGTFIGLFASLAATIKILKIGSAVTGIGALADGLGRLVIAGRGFAGVGGATAGIKGAKDAIDGMAKNGPTGIGLLGAALGGPLAAGLGLAAVGVGILATKWLDSKRKAEEAKKAFEETVRSLRDDLAKSDVGALELTIEAKALASIDEAELNDVASKLGISVQRITDAVLDSGSRRGLLTELFLGDDDIQTNIQRVSAEAERALSLLDRPDISNAFRDLFDEETLTTLAEGGKTAAEVISRLTDEELNDLTIALRETGALDGDIQRLIDVFDDLDEATARATDELIDMAQTGGVISSGMAESIRAIDDVDDRLRVAQDGIATANAAFREFGDTSVFNNTVRDFLAGGGSLEDAFALVRDRIKESEDATSGLTDELRELDDFASGFGQRFNNTVGRVLNVQDAESRFIAAQKELEELSKTGEATGEELLNAYGRAVSANEDYRTALLESNADVRTTTDNTATRYKALENTITAASTKSKADTEKVANGVAAIKTQVDILNENNKVFVDTREAEAAVQRLLGLLRTGVGLIDAYKQFSNTELLGIIQQNGGNLPGGFALPTQGAVGAHIQGTHTGAQQWPWRMALGGTANRPLLIGEGNPNFEEFIIPTDPAFRNGAMKLYDRLGERLGVTNDNRAFDTSTTSTTSIDRSTKIGTVKVAVERQEDLNYGREVAWNIVSGVVR